MNYKTPAKHGIKHVTAELMQRYLDDGQFPAGSMGPKVEAAIRFLRNGGRDVVVTSYDHLLDAVHGKAGTHITL